MISGYMHCMAGALLANSFIGRSTPLMHSTYWLPC